jgi:hypothetical protein
MLNRGSELRILFNPYRPEEKKRSLYMTEKQSNPIRQITGAIVNTTEETLDMAAIHFAPWAVLKPAKACSPND